MSFVPKTQIIKLYRQMMRAGSGFEEYGFKNYAHRRIRAGFQENRDVTDVAQQQALIQRAQKDLAMLKRQAIVNQMYSPGTYYMDSVKFI